MNTPSKEALEAAQFWYEQAEARVKELEAACAELVTDGNAITLAANLARQSERVKELEALAQTQMAKLEEIHALRAANADLKKQEAESRRLFYTEQDKRQSAEYRSDALAGALGALEIGATKFLKGCDCQTDTEYRELSAALERARSVLALHAAGEPEVQT